MPRQFHLLDQYGAGLEAGTLILITAHRHDMAEHVGQIASNGDLLYRIEDLAIFNQKPAAPRE